MRKIWNKYHNCTPGEAIRSSTTKQKAKRRKIRKISMKINDRDLNKIKMTNWTADFWKKKKYKGNKPLSRLTKKAREVSHKTRTHKKILWTHICQKIVSVQFSSVTQSCPTLCDPINCSMPGLPVHHQLREFTQTHVHWVSDAIQPSHPLSSPSPTVLNLSQHQGLFIWVSSLHQVAKVLEFQLQHQFFQWIFRTNFL